MPFFGSSKPQDGDTVSVNYVGTHDDGTEFDSSLQEFVIGGKSMITGFEDAVREMKVGQKKTVRLEPKDAYGEEFVEETKPLSEYKETISQKVPANALLGKLEQSVPLEQAKQLFGNTEVGTEKKIGEATLKILAVTDKEVSISINDPKAPFYDKVLAVGMETTVQDGSKITVKTIEGTDVEVDIKPQQEIVSQTDTEITLRVKNPHPLAGKALNFEIELLEITKAAPADSEMAAPVN
jgi:FKBP-type peptidyl-prolyl cis-trans isomerase 2